VDDAEHTYIQRARWTPTGSGLVFVHGNDLYYKIHGNRHSRIFRITDTGSATVFNGVPDWLYQGKRGVRWDIILTSRRCTRV
jgi:hypothetical protein